MAFRIFVDLDLSPDARQVLREGAREHQLIFPQKPNVSVLAQAAPDPEFVKAEVAFGQPDPEMVARAPALKWIHVSSSGITRYDNPAFRALVGARNIIVSNSARVYSEPCALHTLSYMLAEARGLPRALRSRAAGGSAEWQMLREACQPLQSQHLVIVGFGSIGRRLVELLHPFEMAITGYRRSRRGDETVPIATTLAELDRELGLADHVVNILPDSAETRMFFAEQRFLTMKPGAVFYNIGRGATVDQDALLRALDTRLASAWLDVTTPEPLPEGHPLSSHPRCHVTPHIAGGHRQETVALVQHFLGNLRRFGRGEPLTDRVM